MEKFSDRINTTYNTNLYFSHFSIFTTAYQNNKYRENIFYKKKNKRFVLHKILLQKLKN